MKQNAKLQKPEFSDEESEPEQEKKITFLDKLKKQIKPIKQVKTLEEEMIEFK